MAARGKKKLPPLVPLKPCPFCGGRRIDIDLVHFKGKANPCYFCRRCKAGGPPVDARLSHPNHSAAARAAWNRRSARG